MSLTQITEASDSKKYLKEFLNKPKLEPFDNIVEPSTTRYSRVGVAFDYAFRFGLLHRLDSNVNIRSGLVAGASVYVVVKEMFPEYFDELKSKFENAKETLEAHEISNELNGKLAARAAFELADLDPIFRTKMMFPSPPITDEEITELIQLYDLIDFSIFESHEQIFLNPTFNKGSRRVGGADADIIAGDTLIDIKTTKHTKFTPEMLRQLIGYSLLANRFGIDYQNGDISNQQIKKIAIYFSRGGKLFVMNLDDCISKKDQKVVLEWILNQDMTRKDIKI